MRKSFKIRKAVLLTEGGRSPTGVSKTGRTPTPAASESAFSIQERPWECGWLAVSTVSFGSGDPHKNRTSGDYRTAPGHSCGCVLLYRCARVSWDGSSCGQCEACCTKHPKDEYDLSFVCG